MNIDIGLKLKELRILKGLTQEELADRAELSKGFISQLERNLTSPSIATLTDILQCLGSTLSEFFYEPPEEQIVFGKTDYFEKYDPELKNNIKWIIPNAQKNRMEPILLTLEAGGETYPDTPHEGEEFGYVLQGTVIIHLGGNTYRAKKGESFYYVADKQHRSLSRRRPPDKTSSHSRPIRPFPCKYWIKTETSCPPEAPVPSSERLR